jgi:hypothetical protein
MNTRKASLEADALERFIGAMRAAHSAFDATRSAPRIVPGGKPVARAIERLDAALFELDSSERTLDAILARGAGH